MIRKFTSFTIDKKKKYVQLNFQLTVILYSKILLNINNMEGGDNELFITL